MSARKRLALFMAATAAASAALWTTLALQPAAGREAALLIRRVANGFYQPEPNKPIFILALGSDQGSPRYDREGSVERGRADSIHIVAINPERKAGTIVGIPRDTLVGGSKINGAMAGGGPERMARVIGDWAGITFDYVMVVSFEGFEDMINELGGVVVDVPYRFNDGISNAFFEKGPQVLGGYQALAFSRDRRSAPRGDFSRSENQGLVMLGALRHARAETFRDPGAMLKYLRIFFRYVRTDLPLDEALRLGMLAVRIQTTDVRNVVVDGYATSTADGASVVQVTRRAFALLADVAEDAILDDPTLAIPSAPPPRPRSTPSATPSPSPTPSETESPPSSPAPGLPTPTR